MKNIAFISLGDESHANAKYLVKSIRKKCDNFKIVQISRNIDPKIKDVDDKVEYEFRGDNLMVSKLASLSLVFKKYGPTLFLDSDMLVCKNLEGVFNDLLENDLIYTSRKTNFGVSDKFQNVTFPEFTNKTINDVMPFNAGFIGINSLGAIDHLKQTCINLPKRFHFWYGDQYAQKIVYDEKIFKILVKDYKYNNSIKNLDNFSNDIHVYHFKGRFKNLIEPFYEKYID